MAYNKLSTANLPDPAIDPAQNKLPAKYFDTFPYTGNGSGLQVGDVIKKPADTIDISNSIIVESGDSLDFTHSAATDDERRTWIYSTWVKRSKSDNLTMLLYQMVDDFTGSDGVYFNIQFQLDNTVRCSVRPSSGNDFWWATARKITDSNWHHIVVKFDSTQASREDGCQIWIDGVLENLTFTGTYTQNMLSPLGATTGGDQTTQQSYNIMTMNRQYWLGSWIYNTGRYYLAETHLVMGTALDANTFGTFDANGIWIPQTPSVTYGTNGFHLDFSDNTSTTTLGEDQAGSNDWTLNNLATTDQVDDSPTDNFATLNSVDSYPSAHTFSEGNLRCTHNSGTWRNARTGVRVTSGQWYWETVYESVSGAGGFAYGVGNELLTNSDNPFTNYAVVYNGITSGNLYQDGVEVYTGTSWTAGDVMGLALDIDARTVKFYKDGTLVYTATSITGTEFYPIVSASATGATHSVVNFGQRAFEETPPTGYLALSENNITVDETNMESPDFVWIKNREQADQHHLYDSVRGVQKALYSNVTTAETNEPNGLLDFNANGFTVGSEVEVNTLNEDYVAWTWKAGGTAVENTDGSITSQVSANTESGFSIVSYTGAGGVSTIGHGLDVAPEVFFVKNRSQASDWEGYFAALGNTSRIVLNLTAAASTGINGWNSTSPTATVFTLNGGVAGNTNGNDHIAYCFHSVDGFSKFGSYTGNGSTDGPFVYTGFKPAFVMVKATSGSESWNIVDTNRNTYNGAKTLLYANLSNAEANATNGVDLLSNGFKPRDNIGNYNSSGVTYIYMAFAENPFKYSNAR